jgi:hypothetical protein
MAYLAGAGTVVAAIAAGLGGGLLIGNIVNPPGTREPSKLEQRAAPQQAQQSTQSTPPQSAASNGSTTPYLAATQQAATAPVVVAPAPSNPLPPSNEASNAVREAPSPAQTAASNDQPAKPMDAPVAKPQVQMQQASTQPVTQEQASSPDNAYAKARDADLKRQTDKRKVERHPQWTARRERSRDDELRDVEQKVREDSDAREVAVERPDSDRPHFGQPMRAEFPRINLFGPD